MEARISELTGEDAFSDVFMSGVGKPTPPCPGPTLDKSTFTFLGEEHGKEHRDSTFDVLAVDFKTAWHVGTSACCFFRKACDLTIDEWTLRLEVSRRFFK